MSERESALRSYERLLEESAEDLYENAPCGYFSALRDGTIVKVNETFLAWTGYRRDDLVGRRRVVELLSPGDRIYYETHYAPLLAMQGAVREIAVEIVRADGSRLPALVNSALKRDDAGVPQLVRTTVFDATDRRRYERELLRARQEAEERGRAALAVAHVRDGVLLVDPDGVVRLLNPAGEAVLGVSAAEALGRPLEDAVAGWRDVADRVPVEGPRSRPTPATLPLARGSSEAWLSIAGIDSGDGVVYTLRDVTAERRLEEVRSEIVAVVSHELRTPLAAASGAAQTLLARADELDEPVRRTLLETVVEQGERQRRILDEILLTSRLDEGSLDIGDGVHDAADVLADVVGGFGPQAAPRLAVDPPERLSVHGDAATIRQALAALVDNALKYSSGPVRLAALPSGRRVRFTVSDQGPGIPAGQEQLVFERFFRLDPAQRGGVPGVGLGLYIARQLALRMGGDVGLTPSARGATFHLELPAAGSVSSIDSDQPRENPA